MITLRVIVDEVLAPVPNGISRYAEDLTRALIATAPPGCTVEGVVASSPEAEYVDLLDRLPGMTLYKSSLARRELASAWAHGFTRLPGMIHAPSLLAPLSKHDRINSNQQTVVTMHDVTAWVHPGSLESRGIGWHRAMARRAHRYADALIVPTHAVANQLAEFLDFGDRVRVIGGAVGSTLAVPADADARAAKLGLPSQYIVSVGGLDERRGLDLLLSALSEKASGDIPLVVVGPDDNGSGSIVAAATALGIAENRILTLGYLGDADLSVVLDRATALVLPSRLEGFGLPLLEAFHFGTPVIHSDTPALIEVAGDAGLVVPLENGTDYPARLAEAIASVASDTALAANLATAGRDRSSLFSWENSAEKVWQLHADL
jgi:glycosyltransferase involved in cell wall biosynthesis